MATVKDSQLIDELVNAKLRNRQYTEAEIRFVMDRYFKYAVGMLCHGFRVSFIRHFKIVLSYVLFSSIPKRHQNKFYYSNKIFGYTFLPQWSGSKIEKYGYTYIPNDFILKKITEVTDTDAIYTLVK